MEALGTFLAGTPAAPLANVLLDLNAGASSVVWIVLSVLLAFPLEEH